MAPSALTVAPSPGLEVASDPERCQIATGWITNQHDVAATPTIATIGPTPGDVRLAAKRNHAIPPATPLDPYARAVMKHALSLSGQLGQDSCAKVRIHLGLA
jgi:hypothetical protein